MIHYSKRLVPVPPTYERIGAGLDRPFSDLIFAKWGFNNVLHKSQIDYRTWYER